MKTKLKLFLAKGPATIKGLLLYLGSPRHCHPACRRASRPERRPSLSLPSSPPPPEH